MANDLCACRMAGMAGWERRMEVRRLRRVVGVVEEKLDKEGSFI